MKRYFFNELKSLLVSGVPQKLIFLLPILLLMISCKKENILTNEQAASKAFATESSTSSKSYRMASSYASLTGEEIFKGIYFFEGNLANNIDLFKDMKTQWDETENNVSEDDKVKFNDFVNQKIEDIKIADPNFFSYFETNMKSGNPLLVKEAMFNGGNILTYVFYQDAEYIDLLNSIRDTAETINADDVINEDGTINLIKLQEVIRNMEGSFTYSNDILSNFGMGEGYGTTLCVQTVAAVTTWVYLFEAQSVLVALNAGLAINAGAVVNVAAAVNVKVYLNKDYYGYNINSGGSAGGGGVAGGTGNGTILCSGNVIPDEVARLSEEGGTNIPKQKNIYTPNPCIDGIYTNTTDDLFFLNIAELLAI